MTPCKVSSLLLLLVIFLSCNENRASKKYIGAAPSPGDSLDAFHGIAVHYNGPMSGIYGRNYAPDGYNLGLKWQCVEFVKRYYYEVLNHKMPDTYGHAKDFFDRELADGALNGRRNLLQFANGSSYRPQVNDIIVFDGWIGNEFGHVGIVSTVTAGQVEIIQQNVGMHTRAEYSLKHSGTYWTIENSRVLGWLRKQEIPNLFPAR